MTSAITCPHCGVGNPAGAAFCESCGKALPAAVAGGPRVIEYNGIAATGAGAQLQHAELRKQLNKASVALLVVAIIQAVLGPVALFLAKEAAQKQAGPGTVIYIQTWAWLLIFGVAAAFFALWIWSRFNPFPAAIVGLVLFISIHLLDAVQDPTSIAKGFIMKIIVIVVLVQAIQAGAKYRDLQKQGAVAA